MASPAIPARSFSARVACLITLLTCLLPLIPCSARQSEHSFARQTRQPSHTLACHPCCPPAPRLSADPLCCAAHPQDVSFLSQALTDPPLLQHAAEHSLSLLPAPEPTLLLPPPLASRLPSLRPPPILSLRL